MLTAVRRVLVSALVIGLAVSLAIVLRNSPADHRALQDLCLQGQVGQTLPEICLPIVP